jgi:hypothetical protein
MAGFLSHTDLNLFTVTEVMALVEAFPVDLQMPVRDHHRLLQVRF